MNNFSCEYFVINNYKSCKVAKCFLKKEYIQKKILIFKKLKKFLFSEKLFFCLLLCYFATKPKKP